MTQGRVETQQRPRPPCKECGKPATTTRKLKLGIQSWHKYCAACLKKKHTYRKHKKDKCEFCGFIPVHICQLDVDHKDGNHKNDNPENLQTLCANCHRLKTFLNKEGPYKDGN